VDIVCGCSIALVEAVGAWIAAHYTDRRSDKVVYLLAIVTCLHLFHQSRSILISQLVRRVPNGLVENEISPSRLQSRPSIESCWRAMRYTNVDNLVVLPWFLPSAMDLIQILNLEELVEGS
jgi:hypothetical protein